MVYVDVVISQLTVSAEKELSVYLIVTVYPVIGDPPLSGSIQVITTSSGTHVVTGAAG